MFRGVTVDGGTPAQVREFIRAHVDIHLHDVHAMLRMPLPESEVHAACNFASSVVLLNVISGLSVTLYSERGTQGTGPLFLDLATQFYPWDLEPQNALAARGESPRSGSDNRS